MAGSLEEIADLAKVAPSTVSRALAGKPGVSDTKRNEIIRIAQQKGFIPDPSASNLRTGKGQGLTIIIDPFPTLITTLRNHSLILHGKRAFGHVHIIVKNETDQFDAVISEAIAIKSRAIIVSGMDGKVDASNTIQLKKRNIPLAFIDGQSDFGDLFRIDRQSGAYQCARLFILNKRRHIMLFTTCQFKNPDDRLSGFIKGFKSLGAALSEKHLFKLSATSFYDGYLSTKELIHSHAVDAIFAYDDETAGGAVKALFDSGMSVPGDVQVAGFDNHRFCDYLRMPLTTIAQPVDEIVRGAVDFCIDRCTNYSSTQVIRSYPTRLILRDSAPAADLKIKENIFTNTI